MSELYPVWIVLKKDEEEGIWIAHCLENDVVSQGEDAHSAYKAGVESASLAMSWDLEEGKDPRTRRPAPSEDYEDLHYLLDQGSRVEEVQDALGDKSYRVIAVRVEFDLDKLKRKDPGCVAPLPENVLRQLTRAA